MYKPNLNGWDNPSQHRGLLVFAQALDECLNHSTVDSFKAPAINLHSNVIELQFLASQVLKNRVKIGALGYAVDELLLNIANDPAIERIDKSLKDVAKQTIKQNKDNADEIKKFAQSFERLLDTYYWESIKECIKDELDKERNNDSIVLLAKLFATEGEVIGYTRDYIYFSTRRFFFKKNSPIINDSNNIDAFFKLFKPQNKAWDVIFRGTNGFNEIENLSHVFGVDISDGLNLVKTNRRARGFLGESKQFPKSIVIRDIKAKEPYGARVQGNKHLNMLADVWLFHNHNKNIEWSGECVAISDDEVAVIRAQPDQMRGCGHTPTENIGTTIEVLAGHHFNRQSSYSIRKALNLHRAAIETKSPENQLLDLWAALEGMLPPPSEKNDRIEHYLNALLPSITLGYPKKIFKYIALCIDKAGDCVIEHIDNSSNNETWLGRVTEFIVLEELEDERKKLYSELNDHPLLRYRLNAAHRSFRSSTAIKRIIKSHRERVSRHIRRIYTTRNQIIHNAEALPYLNTLIENLHDYYDLLLNSIIKVGKRDDVIISLDSALATLELSERLYIEGLMGSREIAI